MKKYELVCVIDAGASSADINAVKERVEALVGTWMLEKDDIGLLPLAYPLRGHDQAYFMSYYVALEQSQIEELKTFLRIEKVVAKFFFYAMKDSEVFMKFADVQTSVAHYVQEEEKRKMRKEVVEEKKWSVTTETQEETEDNE